MTRNQLSFSSNPTGFAGCKVNAIQFYKQLPKLCKTEAEYSGRGTDIVMMKHWQVGVGVDKYLFLWGLRRSSEHWVDRAWPNT